MEKVSYPRLSARTLRFTLGEPRSISVAADGSRVLFVRTPSGTSRVGALWTFDVAAGTERVLADPARLLGEAGEDLSEAERARRERARESGAGVVGYSIDTSCRTAVFVLSGKVWTTDVATGTSRELASADAAIDPRIDPTGTLIAYATASGQLRVIGVDGTGDRALAEPDAADVVWGQAEFVAAEEMSRYRGFWWAPDGSGVLAERYDNSPVGTWYLSDPSDPAVAPAAIRYPAAGTADAEVELWHLSLDGGRTRIDWDTPSFPYLTRVSWTADGPPVIQVMSRDQRRAAVLAVEPASGATRVLADKSDEVWIELVDGVPAFAPGGRVVDTVDDGDTRRLTVDGVAVSPVGVQVISVLACTERGVLALGGQEPTRTDVLEIDYQGAVQVRNPGPGVYSAVVGGDVMVLTGVDLAAVGARSTVLRDGELLGTLVSHAEDPGFRPEVRMLTVGERDLRAAVLFPTWHELGSAKLPVVMAPYGGPHAQLVRCSARGFLSAQWLADQGFCVIVADGRGTPGRGPRWERSIRDEFADVTLQDQVDALAGVAAQYPDADTGRVGIMGWSYGGYLSALAVLARPDVFHAAIAGAPVTDWRLYDTFYTERYLGDPRTQPEVYHRNSLPALAGNLRRPLLLIHGTADDNVVFAHTLRLSQALLAAGRPHSVLPLARVTHMPSDEQTAENLLLQQVDFLRDALGAG